jgi:GNAT superfamily N-acetyltransferase
MIENFSLIRLFPESKEWLIQHIVKLTPDDRYLRFGYSAQDEHITKYVNKTFDTASERTNDDLWYAIKVESEIAATLHVSIRGDVAEFAFTTLPEYRGQKFGQFLFARGYQIVVERNIKQIYMVCLSKNAAMRHIARKFGLAVLTHGTEAEGSINIQYPVSLKQMNKVSHSIIDRNLFDGV